MIGDMKSFAIGVLVICVIVLGYMVYQSQQNTVEIRLPSVKIDKG